MARWGFGLPAFEHEPGQRRLGLFLRLAAPLGLARTGGWRRCAECG
jgi:hypothetical protein